MRYAEDKEQSGEFLRMTLALMAKQSAAMHPMSYAIWYEHVAGVNPPLSKILESRIAANQPLNEDEVRDLHSRFIIARDIELLERLQQKLRTLLEEAAQTAASAVEDTGQYTVALQQTRTRLSGALNLDSVRVVIEELLDETTRMQSATQSVSEKLEARAQEVGLLTQQLQQAQSEAMLDPLTGLSNRRGFDRAAAELFPSRESFQGAALLLADIDHFKKINDTHGHLLGDKVLRAIAQTLQSNIKGRDLAARLGGEEFAVLLTQTTLKGARTLAEQIRAAVSAGRIRRGDGKEFLGSVTLSLGVAVGRTGDSVESLLARADAALYGAKRNGRNQVAVESNEPTGLQPVAATS
jgi:diguanylate cyclase